MKERKKLEALCRDDSDPLSVQQRKLLKAQLDRTKNSHVSPAYMHAQSMSLMKVRA